MAKDIYEIYDNDFIVPPVRLPRNSFLKPVSTRTIKVYCLWFITKCMSLKLLHMLV